MIFHLKEIGKGLFDVDSWFDSQFGVEGSSQRENFRQEAQNFVEQY